MGGTDMRGWVVVGVGCLGLFSATGCSSLPHRHPRIVVKPSVSVSAVTNAPIAPAGVADKKTVNQPSGRRSGWWSWRTKNKEVGTAPAIVSEGKESADPSAVVKPVSSRQPAAMPENPTANVAGTGRTDRGWFSHRPAPVVPSPVVGTAPASAKPMPLARGVAGSKAIYLLKVGDPMVIYLRGLPDMPGGEKMIEDIVDETGVVNLPYIDGVVAAGKSRSELERAIEKEYVDKRIYRRLTVNVLVPSQRYYVRGEVRAPGPFPLVSGVTIVQALAAAGGYTEYADPGYVEIVRAENKFRVNARDLEKNPEHDQELEAGDVIIVHRSIF